MITDERMIRTPKPVRLEGGKIVQMPFKKDIKKKLRAIFAEAESELEQERASGTVAKPKKPPRPGTREHPVECVKSLDRHPKASVPGCGESGDIAGAGKRSDGAHARTKQAF